MPSGEPSSPDAAPVLPSPSPCPSRSSSLLPDRAAAIRRKSAASLMTESTPSSPSSSSSSDRTGGRGRGSAWHHPAALGVRPLLGVRRGVVGGRPAPLGVATEPPGVVGGRPAAPLGVEPLGVLPEGANGSDPKGSEAASSLPKNDLRAAPPLPPAFGDGVKLAKLPKPNPHDAGEDGVPCFTAFAVGGVRCSSVRGDRPPTRPPPRRGDGEGGPLFSSEGPSRRGGRPVDTE